MKSNAPFFLLDSKQFDHDFQTVFFFQIRMLVLHAGYYSVSEILFQIRMLVLHAGYYVVSEIFFSYHCVKQFDYKKKNFLQFCTSFIELIRSALISRNYNV